MFLLQVKHMAPATPHSLEEEGRGRVGRKALTFGFLQSIAHTIDPLN